MVRESKGGVSWETEGSLEYGEGGEISEFLGGSRARGKL